MKTTPPIPSSRLSSSVSKASLLPAETSSATGCGLSPLLHLEIRLRTLKKISLLVTGAALLFGGLALPASALSFTFEQEGFTGGGTIKGSFTATDLNNDGSIYADPWGGSLSGYEVSQFSFSFTGDTFVPDFTSTSLGVLGYDLNGGKFLGDSPSEGIANDWFGLDGYIYASGQGPANNNGGIVIDLTSGEKSVTDQLVTVSPIETNAVPEPASYGTLGFATLAVLVMLRSRRRTSADQSALVTGI